MAMRTSYMCGGRAAVGWGCRGGEGLGDVGAGVACSLRNFYGMRESNFHQFCAGGFKRGIGNFATKRR